MTAPEVRLHHLDLAVLRALDAGDLVTAGATAGLAIPADFARQVGMWGMFAERVASNPRDGDRTVTTVLAEDATVVGHAGFHAAPDARGMVEVGHPTLHEHRCRGFARGAVVALLERCRREPQGPARASEG